MEKSVTLLSTLNTLKPVATKILNKTKQIKTVEKHESAQKVETWKHCAVLSYCSMHSMNN